MSKLQTLRLEQGLSQSQLATKSGVTLSTLQKYERGARDIDFAALITGKALAEALGCKIEDLIEDCDRP